MRTSAMLRNFIGFLRFAVVTAKDIFHEYAPQHLRSSRIAKSMKTFQSVKTSRNLKNIYFLQFISFFVIIISVLLVNEEFFETDEAVFILV